MEYQTISQISKNFNLSTRTLRYYEQIGLIQSEKKDSFAYRTYSEYTVNRLRQIVILRKLRIPLKQIAEILENEDATALIEAFHKTLIEVNEEITALSTIRDIISKFIMCLNERTNINIKSTLLEHTDLISAVDALAIRKTPIKPVNAETKAADLQAADKTLRKITDRDVRIIYLPPTTVASIHVTGQDEHQNHAEYTSAILLEGFIKNTNLKTVYPAARVFGFNNPDGLADDDPRHGYERWVSIPADMDVRTPFVKKTLSGGLYAAYAIQVGAWDEGWHSLHEWVSNSSWLDFRWGTVDGVCGWLEEHINYWDWHETYQGKNNQIDLLLPVKRRSVEDQCYQPTHL